jgi:putative tryptophan/tyrosine transport system substrate-binding protein
MATDPFGGGLVASMAATLLGLSVRSPDLAGKRLELLRDVLLGLRGLATMAGLGMPRLCS